MNKATPAVQSPPAGSKSNLTKLQAALGDLYEWMERSDFVSDDCIYQIDHCIQLSMKVEHEIAELHNKLREVGESELLDYEPSSWELG
jgi:hypothetical protein